MTGTVVDVLKVMTTVSSISMCLSPTPSVVGIYRQRAVGEVSILPLVSLFASCHVWYVFVPASLLAVQLDAPRRLHTYSHPRYSLL